MTVNEPSNGARASRMESASADMCVLDVVADDIEGFADILERLNADRPTAWGKKRGAAFARAELVEILTRLVANDLVRAYSLDSSDSRLTELPPRTLPSGDYAAAWFGITAHGLMVHAAWKDRSDGPP